jgi:glutamine---fructose-6-phosphate transaminase (isomerizing)
MCGIVGYLGKHDAYRVILEGLKRLEYRGYDSAGVCVWNESAFKVLKTLDRVESLRQDAAKTKLNGRLGIGHTRWATHGGITLPNAHPHISQSGLFGLVHNGVIENYLSIKKFLTEHGFTFQSETDTEVLANLIEYHYKKEPASADNNRFLSSVRKSLQHVEGTYGIAVICREASGEMVGARRGSPMIIGLGDNENILASDVSAIALHTTNVVYLSDEEIVHLTQDDVNISTIDEDAVEAKVHKVDWNIEEAELGKYKHFMMKEIFEQPIALENAMRGRFSEDGSTSKFGGLNLTPQELRQIDRIIFCACGTAWHACLVAEYLIERYARIPVEVEYASEFRYRNAPLDKNTLFVVITQSGETIDTLGALREAKRKGYRTLAISNVVGSTIARECDGGIYQHAGPEIGVASTKAFTSQVLISAMLALYMGRIRDLSHNEGRELVEAMRGIPELAAQVLLQNNKIEAIAKKYARARDFMFLGRQILFPVAMEGALKLKEISYIHAAGLPAGEIKHGPIALISEECPSVFVVPQEDVYQKTLSNIQEVKARKGPVIAIAPEGMEFPMHLADDAIFIPRCHPALQPILATIPLQLLAYHIAAIRGCDVDKPRNLAKSVTVE